MKVKMAMILRATQESPHHWVGAAEAAVKQLNSQVRARMGQHSSPDLLHDGISNMDLKLVVPGDKFELDEKVLRRDAKFLSDARVKVCAMPLLTVQCCAAGGSSQEGKFYLIIIFYSTKRKLLLPQPRSGRPVLIG
jgi:hypothetical protein